MSTEVFCEDCGKVITGLNRVLVPLIIEWDGFEAIVITTSTRPDLALCSDCLRWALTSKPEWK